MPKLEIINDNMYQKKNTGADYNRALGVLKDTIVSVTAAQAISCIIPTGFKYIKGSYELEVFVNGVFKRINQTIDGTPYGDYEEYTNFSVQFNPGVIVEGAVVRFRVTSANYRIGNEVTQNEFLKAQENLEQLSVDTFGSAYTLDQLVDGSTRGIGQFTNSIAIINLKAYRTWTTATIGTTITNFTGCVQDDIRSIIFTNNTTTIQHNSNIILEEEEDLVGKTGQILTLIYANGIWREKSNSSPHGHINKYSDIISGNDWIYADPGNIYSLDISSLGSNDVIMTCYDNETSEEIYPINIQLYSDIEALVQMTSDSTAEMNVVISEADFKINISAYSWTSSLGSYYTDINLETIDSTSVIITCYDSDTNEKIMPANIEIEIVDNYIIRIWMTEAKKILVLGLIADHISNIRTSDWVLDPGSGNYYFDNNISYSDSTSVISYFYNSDTNLEISPTKVEHLSGNLRVWMNDNLQNLIVLLKTENNITQLVPLTGSSIFKTYYAPIYITGINSTDVIVTCYDNVTKRTIQYGPVYDLEIVSSSIIKIWATTNIYPVKVVIIG